MEETDFSGRQLNGSNEEFQLTPVQVVRLALSGFGGEEEKRRRRRRQVG